jgi:uncharacterized RDD family membrane protein YckC
MWHYVENGQQAGPVTREQLDQLFAEGRINGDTLVWQPGQPDWRPYRESIPAAASAADNPPASGQAEAICAECGKMFPLDETIRHGDARVCAGCKPVFLQKLAEGARINTGELNLAGIGTRFAAVFLDGLMLGAINIGIKLIAGIALISSPGQPKASVAVQLMVLIIQTGIGVSYETYFIGKYGATLGKMACKIKVVTADGGRVSYARACGRYFAKILSALTCMIGYIIAIFDKQKRALHDHICNTRVVMK